MKNECVVFDKQILYTIIVDCCFFSQTINLVNRWQCVNGQQKSCDNTFGRNEKDC